MPLKITLKRCAFFGLAALVASGAFAGWKFYAAASKVTGTSNPISLVSSFVPSDLKTVDGRVNVLLAGYSADDAGHSGAELTDSIMVLSVDTADHIASVISVPRDLWVNIPGYGYSKINAAYEYGGMALLEQTVTQSLGIEFSYYSLINYSALKQAVDAVGGITITIASDDSRGIYDPNTGIDLPNGTVTLDGQTALNLARSRGDGYGSYGFANSDFDRTIYQQAMLVALKNKAANSITNPLKIGSLVSAIGDNVKTDMTVGEMETLYSEARSIGTISQITLNSFAGTNYLRNYTTSGGQSALIPAAGIDDFSAIQAALASVLE